MHYLKYIWHILRKYNKFLFLIYKDGSFETSKKYSNEQLKNNTSQLENNFKPINKSINGMNKFEKKN